MGRVVSSEYYSYEQRPCSLSAHEQRNRRLTTIFCYVVILE